MNHYSYLQRFGEVELAVRRRGSGMPFVWGHALMGSMRVEESAGLWDWERLASCVEVVRYDARGHGNSDGSYAGDDYRWDRMAADMLAVAASITGKRRDGRCLLGGMSMGAATALTATLQQPERVAGQVLALPPTAWETRRRQAGIYRRLAWISGLFGAAPYRLLELLPIPLREDGRNQLALHTMRGLAQANPLHVQAALQGAARSDMVEREQLEHLRVPTLILAWEDDTAHPVSTATELAERLPDARLVICHPSDVSDWETELVNFVRAVAAPRRSGRSAPRRRKRAAV